MINYEVMFIIDPALEDDKKEATVETVKGIIAAEGEVGNVDVWGMRKLAYPIQHKSTGFYTLIEFDAEPNVVKKLEIAFRRDEKVIRFLIFRNDKHAAEYAAKRRSLKGAKREESNKEVELKEVEAKED